MRLRIGLALLAAAAIAGVAAALAAAGSGPGKSGLYGVVMRGPVTPVCMAGTPCDEPAKNFTLIFTPAHGGAATRVKTDSSGAYRVKLKPGRYNVATTTKGLGSAIEPASVTIRSGRCSKVDFAVDTGIR